MKRSIVVCSICGGQVTAHEGVWMSVVPPPPPSCESCGAVMRESVIEMVPARYGQRVRWSIGTGG